MDSIVPSDIPLGKFYVYTLAYPKGIVFYVGKGTGKRIKEHEYEARKGGRSHKCNVIRKIWRNGGQIVKTILAFFETEREAHQYEIALIILMRGHGRLTNLTDGGEGTSGLPEEARQKRGRAISKIKKGHLVSEETRQRISKANRGRPSHNKGKVHTIETRRKISEAKKGTPSWNKGKHQSEEARRKMSETRKGKPRGPRPEEVVKKVAAANRGKVRTEEQRRNIGDAQRGKSRPFTEEHKYNLKTSPKAIEQRRRLAELNRGKKRPPEIYQKIVETKRRNRQAKIDAHTSIPITWPLDPPSLLKYEGTNQLSLWNDA